MLRNLCPCCGRHCYLDKPQCERGIEYTKTGVIPPRKHKPNGRKPSEQKMKYLAMDQTSKLKFNIQEMAHMLEVLEGDVLTCLREEDKTYLLMLLEKIRHDWHHRSTENHKK